MMQMATSRGEGEAVLWLSLWFGTRPAMLCAGLASSCFCSAAASFQQGGKHMLGHSVCAFLLRKKRGKRGQPFVDARMELRVGKKYRLSKKIGGGSFGDIFHGELRGRV